MSKLKTLIPALALLLIPSLAFAEGVNGWGETTPVGIGHGLIGLGAGLAIGLAALGCGLGQGRLADSALSGMARNPSAAGGIRTSMMLALAFPESLVLFCFVISIMMVTWLG
jgi:F-type H+-transporting ATPase subunit c